MVGDDGFFFGVLENGIGVSGGTASGKTTVCDMIIQQLHDHRVCLVNQVFFLLSAFNLFGIRPKSRKADGVACRLLR